jgi:hypothetical protein
MSDSGARGDVSPPDDRTRDPASIVYRRREAVDLQKLGRAM